MKKILSKLMLYNILTICSLYAGEEKTEPIDICDFTKEFLDTCGVESSNGAIFFPKDATGNNRQWLTYENNKCYDLQNRIMKTITNSNTNLINPEGGGGEGGM